MKLSEEMRLLLYNQYQILKIIDKDERERYEVLQTIVSEGYEYNYGKLGDFSSVNSLKSKFVFDVLSMIDALQVSYSNLKNEEKELIDKERLYFKGFDGNEELIEYKYAMFVIEDLKRYKGLGIEDFNSHCDMINTYKEMLQKWSKYNENHNSLTMNQIQDIIENYF